MGPIFKIISFTKNFWKWYFFMGFFVIAVSLLSLVNPFLSKQVVDIIVNQLKGSPQDLRALSWIFFFIISTDIFSTILTATSQWVGDILAVNLQTFLSQHFYEHLLQLDIGFYDNQITGQIVNKMYRGISSITDFIQNMTNNFLPFFLTAFITIVLLARYSIIIAILLAILFPIYIIISHGSSLAWRKFEDEKNTINDISQGRVFESISGIRVVKAFVAEAKEITAFVKARRNIENLAIKQTKGWHLYDFYRRVALNVILFSIYTYIVYWTFHNKFTIGEMTLMLQLVNQARFPLFAMSFILGQIQQASSGSKEFFKLLETKTEVNDYPNASQLQITPNPKGPLIEFKNVDFNYEKDKQILKNINFQLMPKKKLALVGESGQGKSTIINLLLRYYEPQQGEIYINGQNISHVTQKSLRDQIAVVFQESLLFSGTIMENIRYGKPTASEDDIISAAKAANAHNFITELPDKYHSIIGERGIKLSGGQKQRIAIARAMLKNAQIIILDEATSSLDSKSEIQVQEGLDRLLHNRTSVIIAHRLSTIANANHVLVVAKGTVAESGTPKTLLEKKHGLYSQLVSLQRQLLTSSEEKQNKLKEFDLVN